MTYPLIETTPEAAGLAPKPLAALDTLVRQHIEEGRYPGAQIAIARHGKLALFRTYGDARTDGTRVPAANDTLFLLFSQTKVLTSSAVWALVEEGKISFMDRIADHLPEFAARGKADITLQQVMTHQGGFPNGDVSKSTWTDHARMRAEVCDFSLEWTPGTRLQYHGRAAHLVQAMVIEAVTGQDYRDVIRTRVIEPLGLGNEIYVGVPAAQQPRCADTLAPEHQEVCRLFVEHLPAYLRLRGGPRTATHGDFRLDNLLFQPDSARPVVVDWQTAAWGGASVDAAYFIGGCMEVDDRRAHEGDLLAHYHGALCSRGVRDYPLEQLRADTRRDTFAGILMAVVASMVVQRTERGDLMFLTSCSRHAQHALDADAPALLLAAA